MAVNKSKSINGNVNRIAVSWTSDAAGVASESIAIDGVILRVQFVPAGGGSQPTSLYDVTLLDEGGQDVLAGQGANLSNSVATSVCPGVPFKDGTTTSLVPVAVAEIVTLNISGAGNTKSGSVNIYVR